jgi:hypothetical protein
MARVLASELLEEEVQHLAGERYNRDKPHGGRYCRWGSNPRSIRIAGERVPNAGIPAHVPRVRNTEASAERPLQSYQAMKRAHMPEELSDAILLGLAQGDSEGDPSQRVAGQQGDPLHGRDHGGLQTRLCFTEATTEHSAPIKELFRDLLERGPRLAGRVLCVIDGSKGLREAIGDVFGRKALVQRCQWHKRENVVGYLPKADQPPWRAKLQRAYEEGSYAAARERLMGLRADLEQLNRRAARSLTEGLEETLTLPPTWALRRAGAEPEDNKLLPKPK